MDERLKEMLDHYEIRKTLSEYCHGCDRCDEGRMAGVYLEDSWDEHGVYRARGADFARTVTKVALEHTQSLYHLLGQTLIRITGDEAGAETYFFAVSIDTRDGKRYCNQLGGRFVDSLVREEDRWKVKKRIALRDWTISLPIEQVWEGANALTEGLRSNADPSFAALGIVHGGMRQPEQA